MSVFEKIKIGDNEFRYDLNPDFIYNYNSEHVQYLYSTDSNKHESFETIHANSLMENKELKISFVLKCRTQTRLPILVIIATDMLDMNYIFCYHIVEKRLIQAHTKTQLEYKISQARMTQDPFKVTYRGMQMSDSETCYALVIGTVSGSASFLLLKIHELVFGADVLSVELMVSDIIRAELGSVTAIDIEYSGNGDTRMGHGDPQIALGYSLGAVFIYRYRACVYSNNASRFRTPVDLSGYTEYRKHPITKIACTRSYNSLNMTVAFVQDKPNDLITHHFAHTYVKVIEVSGNLTHRQRKIITQEESTSAVVDAKLLTTSLLTSQSDSIIQLSILYENHLTFGLNMWHVCPGKVSDVLNINLEKNALCETLSAHTEIRTDDIIDFYKTNPQKLVQRLLQHENDTTIITSSRKRRMDSEDKDSNRAEGKKRNRTGKTKEATPIPMEDQLSSPIEEVQMTEASSNLPEQDSANPLEQESNKTMESEVSNPAEEEVINSVEKEAGSPPKRELRRILRPRKDDAKSSPRTFKNILPSPHTKETQIYVKAPNTLLESKVDQETPAENEPLHTQQILTEPVLHQDQTETPTTQQTLSGPVDEENHKDTIESNVEPLEDDPVSISVEDDVVGNDSHDEPNYDESSYDEPSYDEPSYDEPSFDEPTLVEPVGLDRLVESDKPTLLESVELEIETQTVESTETMTEVIATIPQADNQAEESLLQALVETINTAADEIANQILDETIKTPVDEISDQILNEAADSVETPIDEVSDQILNDALTEAVNTIETPTGEIVNQDLELSPNFEELLKATENMPLIPEEGLNKIQSIINNVVAASTMESSGMELDNPVETPQTREMADTQTEASEADGSNIADDYVIVDTKDVPMESDIAEHVQAEQVNSIQSPSTIEQPASETLGIKQNDDNANAEIEETDSRSNNEEIDELADDESEENVESTKQANEVVEEIDESFYKELNKELDKQMDEELEEELDEELEEMNKELEEKDGEEMNEEQANKEPHNVVEEIDEEFYKNINEELDKQKDAELEEELIEELDEQPHNETSNSVEEEIDESFYKEVNKELDKQIEEELEKELDEELNEISYEDIVEELEKEVDEEVKEAIEKDLEKEIHEEVEETIAESTEREINEEIDEENDEDLDEELDEEHDEELDEKLDQEIYGGLENDYDEQMDYQDDSYSTGDQEIWAPENTQSNSHGEYMATDDQDSLMTDSISETSSSLNQSFIPAGNSPFQQNTPQRSPHSVVDYVPVMQQDLDRLSGENIARADQVMEPIITSEMQRELDIEQHKLMAQQDFSKLLYEILGDENIGNFISSPTLISQEKLDQLGSSCWYNPNPYMKMLLLGYCNKHNLKLEVVSLCKVLSKSVKDLAKQDAIEYKTIYRSHISDFPFYNQGEAVNVFHNEDRQELLLREMNYYRHNNFTSDTNPHQQMNQQAYLQYYTFGMSDS